jgi:hypothetical protein
VLYTYSSEKNALLKQERGICFDDVIEMLKTGQYQIIKHPNDEKYPHQVILELSVNDYMCHIPAVKTEAGYFLKTLFPNRKANKRKKDA